MVKAKESKVKKEKAPNRYSEIISEVFRRHYKKGNQRFGFERKEFAEIATEKGIELPKNQGDTIYSFKYRASLPTSITDTAPEGYEWIIAGAGVAKYEFRLVKPLNISPREHQLVVKIPDATPEIIGAHALGDEQALLAKVRYNRLVDIFLGITASSLQNHLRTTVQGIGQIEIDELYVGIDRSGSQYVVPVQAKGGKDKHGRQQTEQDIACCRQKFPALRCRPVSAQFMTNNKIAMFELTEQDGDIRVVSEEHYELVPASSISAEDLAIYSGKKKA
ncbi:endonuclease [Pseudoxanthomonas japonensis]|uniref:Endonuclease n=1 Tax=Pseudoxanthomonas japonensis TaxID=69284 RepID=A0ABQ6ZLN8_9GAMM|nr:endonuclease [Pseudoxanthomonas japonensis]KAF1727262.1 endonuclease [Pseudoxanthomonas japonensis]